LSAWKPMLYEFPVPWPEGTGACVWSSYVVLPR
jgi:hypothetical protein